MTSDASRRRFGRVMSPLCVLALVVAGCGQERSPEAYCDAFWDKAIPLHEQYTKAAEEAEANPIGAIMNLFSSPRDLAGVFDSMAKAAPEEIRTDTEAVRDSFNKLADSYGIPNSVAPNGAFSYTGKQFGAVPHKRTGETVKDAFRK